MSWRIRRATPGDAEAVATLLHTSFATYSAFAPEGWKPPPFGPEVQLAMQALLGHPEVWFVAAEDDAGHAGHCGFAPAHRRRNMKGERLPGLAHLWQLFVREDLWGTGLAADLHERALLAMRERGYTRARLLTPAPQARARAFYERRGWSETAFTVDDAEPLAGLPVVEYGLEL